MKIKNYFFWICLTGTILLAAGVIFLPRYFSRSLDLRDLNHAEISARDGFSFLEPGSGSVQDNVQAFSRLNLDGTELVKISSIQEPIQINKDLIYDVYSQAIKTGYLGVIPGLEDGYPLEIYGYHTDAVTGNIIHDTSDFLPRDAWMNYAKSAKYYSLTYESEENPNKKEILNFCYICFSDDKTFEYWFLVDSVSCQIYYAKIYNDLTDLRIAEQQRYSMEEPSDEKGIIYHDTPLSYLRDWFSAGCMEYYGADSFEYISSENLHNKLGLLILYYEMDPLYMEQIEAETSDTLPYRGIIVGFQEIINKIYLLES